MSNPVLDQFLSESHELLQAIDENLLTLESRPDDQALMSQLFRHVHTLKGNCGLFDFPDMLRVIHAAEDVMTDVREGQLEYSRELADVLLEVMDYVAALVRDIEQGGMISAGQGPRSAGLAQLLRSLRLPGAGVSQESLSVPAADMDCATVRAWTGRVPEPLRQAWIGQLLDGACLSLVVYRPEPECFFKGEDPLHLMRQMPQLLWCQVEAAESWPDAQVLDIYQCNICLIAVTGLAQEAIHEHFRYVPEQVAVAALTPGHFKGIGAAAAEADALPANERPLMPSSLALASSLRDALLPVLQAQQAALAFGFSAGRLQAVGASLRGCLAWAGHPPAGMESALAKDLADRSCDATAHWLAEYIAALTSARDAFVESENALASAPPAAQPAEMEKPAPAPASGADASERSSAESLSGRRTEESSGMPTTLKVEQGKIDRLMNLIGEMVVAKNGLPYLAGRAEQQYGVRDLAREIKAQYSVINRIAEEMQDAIMQVRMMPVSFIFQRFPRLVRDITRRLGKEVDLVLEGEDTEADKNIIEALADPLIHIVRNSLDHGIELPDARREAGKPAGGRLLIRASQESDRVVIEIADDGKGIDPESIKRKAYERGLIDEAALDRLNDQEAINLVFLPGFSTAETVSDLSGRGVGMDVVRTAVEKINGTVQLSSVRGQGTRIRMSLPLSMAVTNVMIIESDNHIYGVPMDMVVETVRVPSDSIHTIKNRQVAVLRGRIVPLCRLNDLLASAKPQRCNGDGEIATLVLRVNDAHIGVMVDDFREVVDIILKPMSGILSGIPGYSGSALLGDGSVLMVLNPKELLA
jgi:two-component system chemotaxis sensor kinase CheA